MMLVLVGWLLAGQRKQKKPNENDNKITPNIRDSRCLVVALVSWVSFSTVCVRVTHAINDTGVVFSIPRLRANMCAIGCQFSSHIAYCPHYHHLLLLLRGIYLQSECFV